MIYINQEAIEHNNFEEHVKNGIRTNMRRLTGMDKGSSKGKGKGRGKGGGGGGKDKGRKGKGNGKGDKGSANHDAENSTELPTVEQFLKTAGFKLDDENTAPSYMSLAIQSLKANTAVRFCIRLIAADQFPRKFNEHLERLAERMLRPAVCE